MEGHAEKLQELMEIVDDEPLTRPTIGSSSSSISAQQHFSNNRRNPIGYTLANGTSTSSSASRATNLRCSNSFSDEDHLDLELGLDGIEQNLALIIDHSDEIVSRSKVVKKLCQVY